MFCVVGAAGGLHGAVEFARRTRRRAVEHHVLEIVRDAGDARVLVAAAHPVEGVEGHIGDVVVGPDDDLQTIVQRARDHALGPFDRGGLGGGGGRRGDRGGGEQASQDAHRGGDPEMGRRL